MPPDTLAEIVDFIYFIRRRMMHPEAFEEELQSMLLNTELHQLSREEEAHLEKEFEDYDKLYPRPTNITDSLIHCLLPQHLQHRRPLTV